MSPFQTLTLALALTLASGCFSSEDEYKQLVEERDELAVELARANQEHDILNRARYNIAQQQQQLQDLLTVNVRAAAPPPAISQPAAPSDGDSRSAAASSSSAERSQAVGGRRYKPKPGDTLSTIAERHNTNVRTIINLNPFLSGRRNYMIYDTDELVLP